MEEGNWVRFAPAREVVAWVGGVWGAGVIARERGRGEHACDTRGRMNCCIADPLVIAFVF